MNRSRVVLYVGAIVLGVFLFDFIGAYRLFDIWYYLATFLISYIIGDLVMMALLEKVEPRFRRSRYETLEKANQVAYFIAGIFFGGVVTFVAVLEFDNLNGVLLQAVFLATTFPFFLICLFYFEKRIGYKTYKRTKI